MALVGLAGCGYHFDFTGTHYQCGPNGECPSGQTCIANACVSSVLDAPGNDAPMLDGPGTPLRCGTYYGLHDSFDAATPWWQAFSDGAPIAALSGGELVITMPAGAASQYAGFTTNYRYDLTESALEVEVAGVGPVDTLIELRDHNNYKLQVLLEGGMLQAVVLNAPGAGVQGMIPYDPVAQRWWRIRETAGMTYWEYSADGTSWSLLAHEADPFGVTDLRAFLTAGGEQASGPTTARFASVNTKAPTAGACGVDTLVDDLSSPTAFTSHLETWADNGASSTLTGGQIVISTNGTSGVYAGFESTHLFDLRGHSLYVDVSPVSVQTDYLAFMAITAPNDNTTFVGMQVDGSTLYALERLNNSTIMSQGTPYDSAAQRFWRVGNSGTQITFETSSDGANWVQLAKWTPTIDLSSLQFGAGAGEYNTVSAATSSFSGVNTP
jgi:hypothetical protein